MTNLKNYNSNEILAKIDSIINELTTIKNMVKDNDDFKEVVMTEEISKSKFKESSKTLNNSKKTHPLKNNPLDTGYKDYLDIDSMPNTMY